GNAGAGRIAVALAPVGPAAGAGRRTRHRGRLGRRLRVERIAEMSALLTALLAVPFAGAILTAALRSERAGTYTATGAALITFLLTIPLPIGRGSGMWHEVN